ncbi:restriction endonuclease subunit S [Methylotuvimicrobium sp. KM1]|uniref:restriction endonuclease subunit S n=1 Tax=Methylotuvimicrobium sp. KM1 TaxID=3377707 RepID=UPI00384F7D24
MTNSEVRDMDSVSANDAQHATTVTSDWPSLPLSKVTQIIRGVTYRKNDSADIQVDGYLPVLRANNIQNNRLLFDDLVYVPGNLISEQQKIKCGDIVVAMSSGSRNIVGKAASAIEDWIGGFGAFCGVLRPITSINARYVKWFTVSSEYRNKVSELAAGVNINNLKPSHFDEILIPIAPLSEQHQIAAKLDELLAQVDSIKTRLDSIPKILKRFRQSVLAAAVSGKLTEDWREVNSFDVGKEILLLKKDRDDEFNLLAEQQLKRSGQNPRKLDFSTLNDEPPFRDIPNGWKLIELGEIICYLTDYHANGSYETLKEHVELKENEDYACMIRATNFEKNNFSDLLIYISVEAYHFLGKSKLFGGEILIGKIGNAGSVYLMPNLNRPASLAMNLFAIRFSNKLVNSKYIYYFLKSHIGEQNIQKYVRGVATKSIDKKSLRSVYVNFPSHGEQTEIVNRVEQLFTYADQIEQRVKDAQSRVNHLTQSILAKAFCGELTADWRAQNPDLISGENSAEALLRKINAERTTQKVRGKKCS